MSGRKMTGAATLWRDRLRSGTGFQTCRPSTSDLVSRTYSKSAIDPVLSSVPGRHSHHGGKVGSITECNGALANQPPPVLVVAFDQLTLYFAAVGSNEHAPDFLIDLRS